MAAARRRTTPGLARQTQASCSPWRCEAGAAWACGRSRPVHVARTIDVGLLVARLHRLPEFYGRHLNSLVTPHDIETPTPNTTVTHMHTWRQKTAFTSVTDLPVPLSSGTGRARACVARVIVTSVRVTEGGRQRTNGEERRAVVLVDRLVALWSRACCTLRTRDRRAVRRRAVSQTSDIAVDRYFPEAPAQARRLLALDCQILTDVCTRVCTRGLYRHVVALGSDPPAA